jgi:hypothetical protein
MLMFVAAAFGLLPALAIFVAWLAMRGDLACPQITPICSDPGPAFDLRAMLFLKLVALPVTAAALVFLANAMDLAKAPGDIHSEEQLAKEET